MAKNGPERAKNDCLGSKNGEKGDMDLASTLSPPLSPHYGPNPQSTIWRAPKGRIKNQFLKLKTSDIENITIQNDKNFSLSRLEFEIWIKKSQTVLDEATTAWGIKVERVEM